MAAGDNGDAAGRQDAADAGAAETATTAGTRQPVPDDAAVQGATIEIQKLFKDDYAAAKKPAERTALAKKLLAMAAESSAPDERFALIVEARRLATAAAAPAVALDALNLQADTFEIDRFDQAAALCGQLAEHNLSSEAASALVDGALALAADAQAAGQFGDGAKILTAAQPAARKAKLADAARQLSALAKQLSAAARLAEAATAAPSNWPGIRTTRPRT